MSQHDSLDLESIKSSSREKQKKREERSERLARRDRLDATLDDYHEATVQRFVDLYEDLAEHCLFHTLQETGLDAEADTTEVEVRCEGRWRNPRRLSQQVGLLKSKKTPCPVLSSIKIQTTSSYIDDSHRLKCWYRSEWHIPAVNPKETQVENPLTKEKIMEMVIRNVLSDATPDSIDAFAENTNWIS